MAPKKPLNMADKVRQKAKEAEFQGGSSVLRLKEPLPFFKPKKGKNELIFVPFEYSGSKNLEGIDAGESWYRLQVLMHYKVGADDKSIICPRTVNKKCPICEHRASLLTQGRDTKDKEVAELNAKKREFYYVIDLEEEKLKLMETSYFTFGRNLEEEIRESTDPIVPNFADPNGDTGAVVTVRMSEETMGTNKFLEASRFDFDKRTKQDQKLVDEALDKVESLDGALVVMSYDQIKNMFYDLSEEDEDTSYDDDDDQDEAPTRSRRATRDDDDDEEEEKPTRSRRGSAKKEEEEEEKPTRRSSRKQPEPEEDDEEEEEKPVRRGSSRKKVEEEEEEEKPTRRSSSKKKVEEEEEEEEEKPTRSRRTTKPEPEEEEEEEKPTRRGSAKKEEKPAAKKSADSCPGKGTFGEDCDQLDYCEECPKWSDCRDLADELENN